MAGIRHFSIKDDKEEEFEEPINIHHKQEIWEKEEEYTRQLWDKPWNTKPKPDLNKNQFQITIEISYEEIGNIADIDSPDWNYSASELKAEEIGIEKIKTIIEKIPYTHCIFETKDTMKNFKIIATITQ